MNWDIVEGNWKQFKGKAKEQWGKLTDDDLDVIAGKRDQLAGRVQEAYGVSKDEAEKADPRLGRSQQGSAPVSAPACRRTAAGRAVPARVRQGVGVCECE